MSGGLLIGCPSCGQEFAVRVERLGGGRAEPREQRAEHRPPAQRPPASGPQLEVSYSVENGWELDCPQHGWHAAREFPASGRDGAVIKCTGKTNGRWCDVRVPIELARQRAGIGR